METEPSKLLSKLRFIFLYCFFTLSVFQSYSEGTRELRPAAGDAGFMQIWDPTTQPQRRFMTYSADSNQRLYINICNPGERIYFGVRTTNITQPTFVRLRDPNGNIVFGPVQIPTAPGPGLINNYAQAVAGPAAVVGAGGYNALQYTPTLTGNYYIEFNANNANTVQVVNRRFELFDVTVATIATNTIRLGRLWSRAWDLTTGSFTNRYRANMFMYAPDGVVTRLDFGGMQPFGFIVSANSRGCTNTGNIINDRRSRAGNFTFPEYPIFLNDPDSSCFPTGVLGDITAPPTITGCDPQNRCLNVFVNKAGTVDIILELNGIPEYQENSADVLITTQVDSGLNCVPWNSLNGLGQLVLPGTVIPITVDYYNGLTHLPLYDVENHPDGYRVQLVRPLGPQPRLYWDDTLIAGGTRDPFIGCTDPTGCHKWSGNIAPDGITPRTFWGDLRSINTWWFASIQSSNASIPNSITLVDANFFNPPAIPNDTSICATDGQIPLNGSVTIGSVTGRWTTNGSGSFLPNDSSLIGTYIFGPGDVVPNGSLIIRLTSTNDSIGCPPQTDSIQINFSPPPTSNAGPGSTVCYNNPSVNLSGSGVGAGSFWAGGTGIFLPDSSAVNSIYIPSQAEIDTGGVYLKFFTNGVVPCVVPAIDSVLINIIEPIVVLALGDTQVCKNNPEIQLSGSVNVIGVPPSVATGGRWSGGSGSFTPNDSTLNAIYVPTAAEIAFGQVNLILTSIGSGFCQPESDTLTITFIDPPIVDAGVDRLVCDFEKTIALSAVVSPSLPGIWSGGSGTFSPNANDPNATYNITSTDSANGTFRLAYTVTGISGCAAVSDTVEFAITPSPVANAGANVNVCETNPTVNLNGSVSMGATGFWSSLGDGTFFPNASTLNATYEPGPIDIASTVIFLYLNTSGAGCTPTRDSIQVIIGQAPRAEAGPDQSVCRNNPLVTLTGSSLSGITASRLWSGGGGTFTPIPPNQFNVTYLPTAQELTNGSVKLFFRVNTVTCPGLNDSLTINFVNPPSVNAGPAIVDVCTNNPVVQLNGVVSGGGGGFWSNGSGVFNPSQDSLITVYSLTPAEVTAGGLTLALTTDTLNNNCLPVSDSIQIRVLPGPVSNAGPDQTLCKNNAVVSLSGTVSNAGGGRWVGGGGTFTPGRNNLNVTYTPNQNELNAGFVDIRFRTTGNGFCDPSFDTVRINFVNAPTVSISAPSAVCEDNSAVNLSASFTVAGGVRWIGNGGSFIPNSDSVNVIYIPTASEILAGSFTITAETRLNGNCNPVQSTATIQVTQSPVANAGPNQTVCGGLPSVTLNGSVIRATGGRWVSSGSGTFSPNVNVLNANYLPSATDRLNGFVVLTLISTGNGLCNADSSSMVITFTADPVVNAGPDRTVCTSDFPIQLAGSGSAATWFGGNGSFTPNSATLNARYTPSAAEVLNGFVRLRLVTNPNPNCIQVTDTVLFTILQGPVINAGSDIVVCAETDTIQLNGTVTNSPFSVWTTTGTGAFTPNANTPQGRYILSATDKLNGNVNLVLSVPPANGCGVVRDSVRVTINPSVVANAGPDQDVCETVDTIQLNGAVTLATGGLWSSLGGGVFTPNATTLNAGYLPTPAERTAQRVVLVLSSTGNGSCQPNRDTINIDLQDAPSTSAGSPQSFCSDVNNIQLFGTFSNAQGVIWSTSGSGIFSPTANTPSSRYFPSQADTAFGSVRLFITTLGNGTCAPAQDSVLMTLTKRPRAIAGPNQTLCADRDTVQLLGQVFNATGGVWLSTGTGIFVPNATSLNARYIPSAQDKQVQFVSLRLTTTGNGICNPDSNSLIVTFTPEPELSLGLDVEICETTTTLPLSALTTNATGVLWSSNGTGSFSPSNTSPTPTYQLTFADRQRDSILVFATTTGTGQCVAKRDTLLVRIIRAPIINAGGDYDVCEDKLSTSLNGSVQNAGGVSWSSASNGSFFPNSFVANPNYVFTTVDRLNGFARLFLSSTGNGPCVPPPIDTIIITLTPKPDIQFVGDTLVCSDTPSIPLSAVVTVATGGIWNSSGTGIFTPSDTGFNTSYIPSNLDIAAGQVRFTFSTTGNGLCDTTRRSYDLYFRTAPTIDAGTSQTICRSQNSVSLSGTVTNASGVVWSTLGTGGFTPFATDLNANYFPSVADRNNGLVKLYLQTTGTGICKPRIDSMLITINPLPTLNIGNDTSICKTAPGVRLIANYAHAGGVSWTSTGTGSFLPNALSDTVFYVPGLLDTVVTIRSVTTLNTVCNPIEDSLTLRIVAPPTVNAGIDKQMCSDDESVDITGTFANALRVKWTTNGSGILSDTATASIFYQPSVADRLLDTLFFTIRTVTDGICANVSDGMVLAITQSPTVNVGQDYQVCASLDSLPLFAQSTNSPNGFWTTLGSGTFQPSNLSASGFYFPSQADTAAGLVSLVYQANGNNTCFPAFDTLNIQFSTALVINAGGPIDTVCTNDFPYLLNGSGANGSWVGGLGTFSPSRNVLNATYQPTAGEIAAQQVLLTLVSPASGACPPVIDTLLLRILPGPTVNAGPNRTICADSSGLQLNPVIANASAVTWSTSGTGTFIPNDITANAIYVPSAQDIQDSLVVLTIQVTSPTACSSQSDQLTLFINPAPTIFAGFDITICRDVDSLLLQATATQAGGAIWRKVGSVTPLPLNGPNNFSIFYTPTIAERNLGFVELIATTTGTGICRQVSDTVRINLTPTVTTTISPAQVICETSTTVNLSSVITVAQGVSWSSTGSGSFSTDPFQLNPIYALSVADRASDSIFFRLTTLGNGTCRAAFDSTVVRIRRVPLVTASAPTDVCRNEPFIQLSGTSVNTPSVRWKTLGTGTFDNDTILTPRYFPTASDLAANAVTVYLVSTGNAPCDSSAAFATITFNTEPAAVVNAGFDIEICRDVQLINLNGLILNAPGGTWSSTGTGIFLPSNTSLNGFYQPSAADIASDSIFIRLASLPTNVCNSTIDSIRVLFTPTPTVDAGLNDTICADANFIQLSGFVTVANGGVWTTTGTGTFVPNAFTLNAVYQPSASDKQAGQVGLTLTSDGNGTCSPVSDTKILRILRVPEISITVPEEICSDQDSIPISATFARANGVQWLSTGTGIILPTATSPNAFYLPSAADKFAGAVVLTANTTGNGLCQSVSDNKIVRFVEAPKVEAGPDLAVCEDALQIQLNGTIDQLLNTSWTTNGTGVFAPSEDVLSPTYAISLDDRLRNSIIFRLTSAPGKCKAKTDSVIYTLQRLPVVNTGPSSLCVQNGSIQLQGSIQNAIGGSWTTNGTGVFSPSPQQLTPFYFPSASDFTLQRIEFTLTSIPTGACPGANSDMVVGIAPPPFADAGLDKTVCRGSNVLLTSFRETGNQYRWSTLNGLIISNSHNVVVTVSNDTGFVVTAQDSRGCVTTDTIRLFGINPPTFNMDTSFCFDTSLLINSNVANVPGVAGTFLWFRNDSIILGANNSTLQLEQPGIHRILYFFDQCFTDASTNVVIPPRPNGSDRTVCVGSDVTIATTAFPGAQYIWTSLGDTLAYTTFFFDTLGNDTPSVNQVFQVLITDSYGCIGRDTIVLSTTIRPEVVLNDTTGCQGLPVVLNGTPINYDSLNLSSGVYTWFTEGLAIESERDSIYRATTPGIYSVRFAIDQCFDEDSATLIFSPLPQLVLPASIKFCKADDDSVALNVSGFARYEWFGFGADSTDTLSTFYATDSGYYTVTVFNEANCPATDSILVFDRCSPRIFTPSGFTPNGDGKDDFFRLFGEYFSDFSLTIFNRWGEIIFYATDITEGWDGTYKGEEMPTGTYPFIVTYKGIESEFAGPFKKQGSVTLIR